MKRDSKRLYLQQMDMEPKEKKAFILTMQGNNSDGSALGVNHIDLVTLRNECKIWLNLIGSSEPVNLSQGSLKITFLLAPALWTGLIHDIKALSRGESDGISATRREAYVSMVKNAKKNAWTYTLSAPEAQFTERISSTSRLPSNNKETEFELVTVLEGKVKNAGGVDPNFHLQTERGKTIISATEQQLSQIEHNILYKHVRVRVRYKYNPKTGEANDYALIEFIPPVVFDGTKLKELIKKGTESWADVPDITTWVRLQRGGGEQ